MYLFADLQVNEGNECITQTIRSSNTEDVVEDHRIIDIKAQRLTFLGTDQYGRIQLDSIGPIEWKDYSASDKVVSSLAYFARKSFKGVDNRVIENERYGEPEEVVFLIVVNSGAEVRFELIHKIVERYVSRVLKVERTKVSADKIHPSLEPHRKGSVGKVNLVGVVAINVVVFIATDLVVVDHQPDSDPVLPK